MVKSRISIKYFIYCFCFSSLTFATAEEFHLYPTPEARYVGMGSAYVAAVHGPAAILCNPAGLIGGSKYSFALNLGSQAGYSEQFIAGRIQVASKWSVGLGLHRLALKAQTGDSIGVFVGIASELIEKELAFGGVIQGFVNSQSVMGLRVAIGMQYTPHKIITLGTTIFSRGAYENNEGAIVRIPFHAKSGIQLRPTSSLSINMDAELARKNKQREHGELVRVNYGVEWKLPIEMIHNDISDKFDIYLRAGSRSGITESLEKGAIYNWKRPWQENGLSFGFGMIVTIFQRQVFLDFASDEFERKYVCIHLSID